MQPEGVAIISVLSCYESKDKLWHQFELVGPNVTQGFFILKANIAGIEITPDAVVSVLRLPAQE